MRRISYIICAVLLLVTLTFGVGAVGISSMDTSATAMQDSSCQVTTTVTIHIDQIQSHLYYPIPGAATNVTVNGVRRNTTVSGDVRLLDISQFLGNVTGDFSLSINYTLPDVVHFTEDGLLELRLPIACGFAYPVEEMSFLVMLPGEQTNQPTFESGYHQASIEQDMVWTVDGNTITGYFTAPLKDHETVTMKLRVSNNMFPQTLADTRDYTFALYGMAICGGLALLYWLIFLRFQPFRWIRTTEPLQGITAGEVGCVMNMQGVNIHLTVLTWAQLGYIMIYPEKGGKITLRRRMDMGNERKEEEQRLFKKLFAKGDIVSTASVQYASFVLAAGKKPMGMRERIHRRSGNANLFRGAAAGMGLFGGICVAVAMTGGAVLQGLLILVLGALGGLSGWYLQKWACYVVPVNRHKLLTCLAICIAWLLLGLISGAFQAALWMVLGLLIAGIFLSMAGRRTDLGKQAMGQTLGLRNYLRSADKILLRRLYDNDPDCFFHMAPYAIALGVGKAYAKRYGGLRMGPCPYIAAGKEEQMTAENWILRLQEILDRMDLRTRKLPRERAVRVVRNMTKK